MNSESVELFLAQEVGHSLSANEEWLPTVTIDVSQSPAVADLARVHAIEGIGDVRTVAIREGDIVIVGVQLTSPVSATFAIVFDYELHRGFLMEVADVGTLVFATTDVVNAHEERPLWLSVFVDGVNLRQALEFSDN